MICRIHSKYWKYDCGNKWLNLLPYLSYIETGQTPKEGEIWRRRQSLFQSRRNGIRSKCRFWCLCCSRRTRAQVSKRLIEVYLCVLNVNIALFLKTLCTKKCSNMNTLFHFLYSEMAIQSEHCCFWIVLVPLRSSSLQIAPFLLSSDLNASQKWAGIWLEINFTKTQQFQTFHGIFPRKQPYGPRALEYYSHFNIGVLHMLTATSWHWLMLK